MADRDNTKKALLAKGYSLDEVNEYFAEEDAKTARLKANVERLREESKRIEAGPPYLGEEMINGLGATLSGFNERFAFGLPAKGMDAAGLSSQAERDRFREAAPNAATLGDYGGIAVTSMVGPEALIARGGAKTATALAERALAEKAATTLGRQKAAGVGGLLTSTATQGVQNLVDGVPWREGLERMGEAAGPGVVLGMGAQALSDAAMGTGELLRRDRWIGRHDRAKRAGAYEDPEMKSLPKDEEGIQRAAEKGLDRVVKRDQEMGQTASRAYHQAVDPHLGTPVNRKRMVSELEARRAFETLDPDTGIPLNEGVTRAFDKAIDNTAPKPTVGGTLARRRALQEDANFASSAPTDKQTAARKVYQAFRGAVRGASPEVAAADDAYTAHASQAGRRRDILFNTEDNVVVQGGGLPEGKPIEFADELLAGKPQTVGDDLAAAAEQPALRVAKERAATTTLKRVGDINEPGLRARKYIDELAAQDPEFAQALEFIANKKALEGTRLALSELTPTTLTGATGVAGFMPIVRQNARALGAHVGLPVADDAANLGAVASKYGPLLNAILQDRERQRRMSERVKKGGK